LVELKRKENESFDQFLRRFTKKNRDSGVLLEAKKLRWHVKSKNKRQEKDSAIRKLKIDDKKEWLRRIGKLDDYTDSFGRVKIKIKK
jgi:ribosomal protein S21